MYTSREEDLSPTVNYRHTRILKISVLLQRVNGMLEKLNTWKENYKKNPLNFVGVSFELANDGVRFDLSGFTLHSIEKDDDINLGFKETMQNLNWSMLNSYITFLKVEQEVLIKEFNRLETAQIPEDGEKVQN